MGRAGMKGAEMKGDIILAVELSVWASSCCASFMIGKPVCGHA